MTFYSALGDLGLDALDDLVISCSPWELTFSGSLGIYCLLETEGAFDDSAGLDTAATPGLSFSLYIEFYDFAVYLEDLDCLDSRGFSEPVSLPLRSFVLFLSMEKSSS